METTTLNPQYIYVQATTPSDKTQGKLWYNTTTGNLYTSDGTNYNITGVIADDSITTVKLKDDVITTDKILDGAISQNKCLANYTISADTLHSNDTQTYCNDVDYTTQKTITLALADNTTIRVYFEHRCQTSGTVYSKIFKNNVAFGIEHAENSTGATPVTEDLEFSNGDVLTLKQKYSGAGNGVLRHLRIQGTSDAFSPASIVGVNS